MLKHWTKLLAGAAIAATIIVDLPAYADTRHFKLNNTSTDAIASLHVSLASKAEWGEDILGVELMEPNEQRAIAFNADGPTACFYDVKVVTQKGESVGPGVNLCEPSYLVFDGQKVSAQ